MYSAIQYYRSRRTTSSFSSYIFQHQIIALIVLIQIYSDSVIVFNNMNHTTLGLIAVLAAATLVIATLAAAPAFASIGDGNTLTKQKNKAKASASGAFTIAANVQQNSICVVVRTCV